MALFRLWTSFNHLFIILNVSVHAFRMCSRWEPELNTPVCRPLTNKHSCLDTTQQWNCIATCKCVRVWEYGLVSLEFILKQIRNKCSKPHSVLHCPLEKETKDHWNTVYLIDHTQSSRYIEKDQGTVSRLVQMRSCYGRIVVHLRYFLYRPNV